ncbi:S8 family peptidase [Candidatus Pacearchaeota archaeon]|nr:S8 family peptidase [Candidatus Pacearchaeota archaeon]
MLIILLAGFIVFIALPFSSAKYANKAVINKSTDGSVIVNVYDSQNDKWVSEKNFKIPLPNVSERISVSKAKATLKPVLRGKKIQINPDSETEYNILNNVSNETYSELASSELIPWGVERVRAPYVWHKTTGKKIRVALLDTGIDAKHSELNVSGGISFIAGENYTQDFVGHGTLVAGVISARDNGIGIVGVAPNIELYMVKVMDETGGTLSDIISGIDWAIENNMSIISMSFGTDVYSEVLEIKLAEAYNSGIILVAAAGNDGGNVLYPAKYTSVIAAGNIDENNDVPFGNIGSDLEFASPGTDILTTYINNSYAIASGTSFSAPHAAGVAALMLEQNKSKTPNEIRAKLHEDALDLGISGWDEIYGYGLVQAKLKEENNITEARIKNIENKVSALEIWKTSIINTIANFTLTINGLISKTNNQEGRIKKLESQKIINANSTNLSFLNYFKYLSSSDRKNIACGYAKDSHLTSFIDLGWNCTIAYKNTSRGETANCKCKKI